MKKILVMSAGGTPSINYIRSLKEAGGYKIIGADCEKYYLARMEADKKYLVPRATDKKYISYLKKIIEIEKPDFLHAQNDLEVEKISKYRDDLNVKIFYPDSETVEICQDKLKSNKAWEKAGIKVPKTKILRTSNDLKWALEEWGEVWLRAINSPGGGKGSLKCLDHKTGEAWLNLNNGWGNFSASELLTERTVTWMSLWKNGDLVVAQGRERIFWELSRLSPSGVTGLTGVGVTCSDPLLDKVAMESILAIDSRPNGLYGVDLTYDKEGIPNPTEINIGRFFTTIFFFTKLGLNMPKIYTDLGLGGKINIKTPLINPLPADWAWVRGMDLEPILTKFNYFKEEKDFFNKEYKKIK